MPFTTHDRTYDLVLFGATGFTGVYTAKYIAKALPTDLKWAVAGRSGDKLAGLAAELKQINPDRIQPTIEVASASDATALEALAKKTRVLISTVGPYGAYGEPVFKACAESGTHYIDVTGEVPFVANMIDRYEAVAKASGALMFPQSGIESAPADLAAAEVARIHREKLNAQTADVTAAMRIKAAPSGGTMLTVLTITDNFSLNRIRQTLAPYALSPVPRPKGHRGQPPLLTRLTGAWFKPALGRLSTSMSGSTNAAQVERTWGLLESLQDRGASPFSYGPHFSFNEYASVRDWWQGFKMHLMLTIGTVLLVAVPPVRWLLKRLVFAPGEGPEHEKAMRDLVEYRAVGVPDVEGGAKPTQQGFTYGAFRGPMYDLTGILAAEAARTILQDDLKLEGGVYTPSFLGQNYIERLGAAGFKWETKLIDA